MRTYLALATIVATVTACAGDKAGKTAAESTAIAPGFATAPPTITITARDFAFDAPDTVSAGMVTIRLVNQGPDLHHVQLVHLSDGKTAADFEAGVSAMKPGAPSPPWAHDVAGPNSPLPGGEQSMTEQLEPGNYAVVCFIAGADGVPHVMKGMIRALTVTPATTATAPAPIADINVTMSDYAWQITPDVTAGKHVIRIENIAEQSHEMFLAMLPPGKTAGDLAVWVHKQAGPPPGKPVGGISGMGKGTVAYLQVDLEPGEYGIYCFLPDAKDGKTHVEHSMIRQISVK